MLPLPLTDLPHLGGAWAAPVDSGESSPFWRAVLCVCVGIILRLLLLRRS